MTGTTLSHYRIVSELGRGGMGIVYLAEDTKLDRQVAIKVLPSSALASEDDRARFYREAKAAAALNHPNIAQIYEIDEAVPSDAPHGTQPSPFIAMEYIDGEPLDARIKHGPLKLGEAVRLAMQIAGALGEAHDKGIVHRDVKASNVMLTSKGDAKVLDFGLALTAASTKLTRMGSTLGTVAYMSPEQARGEEVDRRTDLWALGVVLYEMIAGRNPFGGDYEQAVVYSILNAEPEPITAVRTGVPMELEWIANKCLSKDRDLRYQSATDLLVDLKAVEARGGSGAIRQTAAHSDVSTRGIPARAVAGGPPTSKSPTIWIAGIVAALLVGLVIGWLLRNPSAEPARPAMTVSVVVPDEFGLSHPTISPDRRYVAFTADGGRFVLRDLTLGTQRVILSGENVRISRFSPDGRWLVFEQGTEGLSIVQVSGGTVGVLSAEGTTPSWIDNDNIVFSDGESIFRTSRVSQQVETVWSPSEDDGFSLAHPETIPGTDIILVTILQGQRQRVGILDLDSGAVEPLIEDAIAGRYVTSGHIVFTEQRSTLTYAGRVFAQPFDLSTRETRGPAVPILSERGYWEFGLNTRGDLVTSSGLEQRGPAGAAEIFRINSETGEKGSVLRTIPEFDAVSVSPDGSWYAYASTEDSELIVGPMDPADGGAFRFASDGVASFLEFSPDAETIYFVEGSFPASLDAMSRSLIDGGRLEDLDFGGHRFEFVMGFTADGSSMLIGYADEPQGEFTALLVDRVSGATSPVLSRSDVQNGFISPDGRFVSFDDNAGAGSTVHVQAVGGGGPWMVASGYGYPRWSREGDALFMRDDNSIYRLPLNIGAGVRAGGEPRRLYTGTANLRYTVDMANGDVIVIDRPQGSDQQLDRLDLILHWGERLKIEAPVG